MAKLSSPGAMSTIIGAFPDAKLVFLSLRALSDPIDQLSKK